MPGLFSRAPTPSPTPPRPTGVRGCGMQAWMRDAGMRLASPPHTPTPTPPAPNLLGKLWEPPSPKRWSRSGMRLQPVAAPRGGGTGPGGGHGLGPGSALASPPRSICERFTPTPPLKKKKKKIFRFLFLSILIPIPRRGPR